MGEGQIGAESDSEPKGAVRAAKAGAQERLPGSPEWHPAPPRPEADSTVGVPETPCDLAPEALGCPEPAPVSLPYLRPGSPCGSSRSPEAPLGSPPCSPRAVGLTSAGLAVPEALWAKEAGDRGRIGTTVQFTESLPGESESWAQRAASGEFSTFCHMSFRL